MEALRISASEGKAAAGEFVDVYERRSGVSLERPAGKVGHSHAIDQNSNPSSMRTTVVDAIVMKRMMAEGRMLLLASSVSRLPYVKEALASDATCVYQASAVSGAIVSPSSRAMCVLLSTVRLRMPGQRLICIQRLIRIRHMPL